MKKLLTIAACAASMVAMADGIPCGDVGVIKVEDVTAHNTVIAASFGDLGGSGAIKVANIIKTTNLANGDQVFIYENGAFKGWTWNGSAWEKSVADFTIDAKGNKTAAAGDAADAKTVAYGSGVWLKRVSNTSTDITVYGLPVSDTITVAKNTTVLCGNPTTTDNPPTITDAVPGDIIKVPSDAVMVKQYRFNGTSWVSASGATITTTLPVIKAGTGFWYKAVNSGENRTITW